MQQSPRSQNARAPRATYSDSALSSMTPPTTPVYIPASQRQRWPQLPAGKRGSMLRRISLELLLAGLLSGLCYWLLFPLPGEARSTAPALLLPALFPWLAQLFWTERLSWLSAALSHISWLDIRGGSPVAVTNLALLLLGAALALLFLASSMGRRATRERLQQGSMRLLLALICLFTLLFGALFLFLPGTLAQDALLSGFDGRLITVYHVNPYLATRSLSLFARDPLYLALAPGTLSVPQTVGPLWLDVVTPLSWLAGDRPALVVLIWRAFALCLHLFNALLIWGVLTKLKPEMRLVGTLLYAWNPAILLLGIGEMQSALAVIFFLLLTAFFLQRGSLQLSWVSLLLAALINPLCLLLLPLFLRALSRETRTHTRGRRFFWWLALLLISTLVLALAYAPYWSGTGLASQLRAAFWPENARNSLLTALNGLPFAAWPPAAWLLTPAHWMFLPALLVGLLLLLGCWIADNLELALLFSSWIFLALALLLPVNSPWFILLPLALALASSSRRTALLAHLLTAGALLAYCLALRPAQWSGQALLTLGLPALIWGWMLFFASTWRMAHHEEEEITTAQQPRRRPGLSRPSWPSRPAAWPSRPSLRRR